MKSTDDLIRQTAVQTIKTEADALTVLAEHLGQSDHFAACIQLIASSPGRLVITGIGKSAIVGQKIVATLNSTGQPSLFLHAADAIHGDLGMIQPHDIILCLSKSGNTPEIKVLIPLLKNFGNKLIAMTAYEDSFLARHCDYVLLTPVEREADPNNLAPTTSTTVQMACGDAIATSLLALRGFTPDDFARFHPGGQLGKQLYLRVADLYVLHERPFVAENATLPDILLEMSRKRLGATAVLNTNGDFIGIITDGDLRRMMQKFPADWLRLTAVDILTPGAHYIDPQALAVDALSLMRQHSISQLVVLEDNHRYLGMVHLHDLVKEGLI